MTPINFVLFPFAPTSVNIQIQGQVCLEQSQNLNLNYCLTGDIKSLEISPLSNSPTRQDYLWETTCFEFFLGIKDTPRYWEFNLAPSGDWNIYRFDGYRQGMQPEIAYSQLPFLVEKSANRLMLSLKFDLQPILNFETENYTVTEPKIDLAVTSVIKSQDNSFSYWALTHVGETADFHLRDSFTIQV